MTVQFSHPKVGSKVRVTYSVNDIYLYAKSPIAHEWVEGTVLPNQKFTNPNAFVLRVNCQYAPIREFNLDGLVDLEYLDGSVAAKNEVDNEVKVFEVLGSKGEKYTVVKEGAKATCTCVGFQYRKACKHTAMIK